MKECLYSIGVCLPRVAAFITSKNTTDAFGTFCKYWPGFRLMTWSVCIHWSTRYTL